MIDVEMEGAAYRCFDLLNSKDRWGTVGELKVARSTFKGFVLTGRSKLWLLIAPVNAQSVNELFFVVFSNASGEILEKMKTKSIVS